MLSQPAVEEFWNKPASLTHKSPGELKSASVGDEFVFVDYARSWQTNRVLIDSNGLKYQGDPDSFIVQYNK